MILNCYKYAKIKCNIWYDIYIRDEDVSYCDYIKTKTSSELLKKEINIKIENNGQAMCYYRSLKSHQIVWL